MRDLIKKFIPKYRKQFIDHYRKMSFSQCGEDNIIDYVFTLRNILNPSYLDIGANHPYFLNNTAIFYERGCRGTNIEANSLLVDLFRHHRSKDINLNIGIGSKAGELDFYIFKDDTLSTFSKEEAEQQKKSGKSFARTEKIQIKTLNYIVSEYCKGVFPDLLSIDVEGVDFEILQSTDFSANKPKIICAETAEYSPIGAGAKRTDYIKYIENLGYYLYADTNLNSIFVEHAFWFDKRK